VAVNIEEITALVGELVEQIDNTITGTYNVGTGKTEICQQKWARVGKQITDEAGNIYLITALDEEGITAEQKSGPATPLTGTIFLPPPFYLPGTKIAANNEWKQAKTDLTLKTPFLWLFEIIRVRKFGRGDARAFETDLRLFCLDETNVAQFNTKDHRREVVVPMEGLAEAFLDVVRANREFKTLEDYLIVTFSRFGVETEQGVIQNIIDADFSGVELQFTLTKYKSNCKC
jgi:hypothetical protein